MLYKVHFSQLPLSQFVENFWLVESSDPEHDPHFIKEFQAFSGLNPSAYLTQRGDYLNYIPIA